MRAWQARLGGWPTLLRIVLTVIAFLLGVWGFAAAYTQLSGHPGPLRVNAFKALQLVVGRFPDDLENREVPPSLEIARWTLPLLTAWTSIALAWRQIRNPVRLRWLRHRGEHLVVAGDEHLAAHALAAERAAGGAAILWTDVPERAWAQRLAELGVVLAPAAPAAGDLDRARALLLVGPSDTANVSLAGAAIDAVEGRRPPADPLPVIARVDDLDLRRAVEPRFEAARGASARVRLVSVPDIAARALFLDHPLDRFRRPRSAARVVVALGWTPTVERFVLRLLAAGHFRDGAAPRVVVIDGDADAQGRRFVARRPGADALAPVEFRAVDLETGLAGALDDLVARVGAPVLAVADAPEEGRALARALALADHLRAAALVVPPIAVRMDGAPDARLGLAIRGFGSLDALAQPERLLQDRHDALARTVHDFYLQGRLDAGDTLGCRASMAEWETLPEALRDDNRLLADCYGLKLRDLGARLLERMPQGAEPPPVQLTRDEIEEMARAEHNRWMAARLVEGWQYAPVRDDARRLHPDIVGFDALSDDVRDLDREQIRVMARLVTRSGRTPVRTLVLGLLPSGTARLAATLAEVRAGHPDRLPIVLGDPADGDTRAALDTALAAGERVALVLREDPDLLLPTLSHEAAASLRRLVLAADTLWSLDGASAEEAGAFITEQADLLVGAPTREPLAVG